jgi:predicted enzyme related to lactoylglutathione lyase
MAARTASSRARLQKRNRNLKGDRMPRTRFTPQQGMVLYAKNKKRVSSLYQKALGLRIVETESSHDLLQGDGYEIIVHAIPRKIAAGITITKPPVPRMNGAIKPTFAVRSLEVVRVAAAKTGGLLEARSEAWHFRGCTVLDGCDPEGNQLQFRQRDA